MKSNKIIAILVLILFINSSLIVISDDKISGECTPLHIKAKQINNYAATGIELNKDELDIVADGINSFLKNVEESKLTNKEKQTYKTNAAKAFLSTYLNSDDVTKEILNQILEGKEYLKDAVAQYRKEIEAKLTAQKINTNLLKTEEIEDMNGFIKGEKDSEEIKETAKEIAKKLLEIREQIKRIEEKLNNQDITEEEKEFLKNLVKTEFFLGKYLDPIINKLIVDEKITLRSLASSTYKKELTKILTDLLGDDFEQLNDADKDNLLEDYQTLATQYKNFEAAKKKLLGIDNIKNLIEENTDLELLEKGIEQEIKKRAKIRELNDLGVKLYYKPLVSFIGGDHIDVIYINNKPLVRMMDFEGEGMEAMLEQLALEDELLNDFSGEFEGLQSDEEILRKYIELFNSAVYEKGRKGSIGNIKMPATFIYGDQMANFGDVLPSQTSKNGIVYENKNMALGLSPKILRLQIDQITDDSGKLKASLNFLLSDGLIEIENREVGQIEDNFYIINKLINNELTLSDLQNIRVFEDFKWGKYVLIDLLSEILNKGEIDQTTKIALKKYSFDIDEYLREKIEDVKKISDEYYKLIKKLNDEQKEAFDKQLSKELKAVGLVFLKNNFDSFVFEDIDMRKEEDPDLLVEEDLTEELLEDYEDEVDKIVESIQTLNKELIEKRLPDINLKSKFVIRDDVTVIDLNSVKEMQARESGVGKEVREEVEPAIIEELRKRENELDMNILLREDTSIFLMDGTIDIDKTVIDDFDIAELTGKINDNFETIQDELNKLEEISERRKLTDKEKEKRDLLLKAEFFFGKALSVLSKRATEYFQLKYEQEYKTRSEEREAEKKIESNIDNIISKLNEVDEATQQRVLKGIEYEFLKLNKFPKDYDSMSTEEKIKVMFPSTREALKERNYLSLNPQQIINIINLLIFEGVIKSKEDFRMLENLQKSGLVHSQEQLEDMQDEIILFFQTSDLTKKLDTLTSLQLLKVFKDLNNEKNQNILSPDAKNNLNYFYEKAQRQLFNQMNQRFPANDEELKTFFETGGEYKDFLLSGSFTEEKKDNLVIAGEEPTDSLEKLRNLRFSDADVKRDVIDTLKFLFLDHFQNGEAPYTTQQMIKIFSIISPLLDKETQEMFASFMKKDKIKSKFSSQFDDFGLYNNVIMTTDIEGRSKKLRSRTDFSENEKKVLTQILGDLRRKATSLKGLAYTIDTILEKLYDGKEVFSENQRQFLEENLKEILTNAISLYEHKEQFDKMTSLEEEKRETIKKLKEQGYNVVYNPLIDFFGGDSIIEVDGIIGVFDFEGKGWKAMKQQVLLDDILKQEPTQDEIDAEGEIDKDKAKLQAYVKKINNAIVDKFGSATIRLPVTFFYKGWMISSDDTNFYLLDENGDFIKIPKMLNLGISSQDKIDAAKMPTQGIIATDALNDPKEKHNEAESSDNTVLIEELLKDLEKAKEKIKKIFEEGLKSGEETYNINDDLAMIIFKGEAKTTEEAEEPIMLTEEDKVQEIKDEIYPDDFSLITEEDLGDFLELLPVEERTAVTEAIKDKSVSSLAKLADTKIMDMSKMPEREIEVGLKGLDMQIKKELDLLAIKLIAGLMITKTSDSSLSGTTTHMTLERWSNSLNNAREKLTDAEKEYLAEQMSQQAEKLKSIIQLDMTEIKRLLKTKKQSLEEMEKQKPC